MMGLTEIEFEQDIETVKDLGPVWELLEDFRWSQERSVLLDDEASKAVRPFFLET